MKIQTAAFLFAVICSGTTLAALPAGTASQQENSANKANNSQTAQTPSTGKPQQSSNATGKTDDLRPAPGPAEPTVKSTPVEAPPAPASPLSFWITIVVVVTAGIVNYWLSSRTMSNQTQEAAKGRQADHQNKVSEYRHAWLQELRNTASDLIKSIHDGQSALMRTNLSRDYRDRAQQQGDFEAAKEQQQHVATGYSDERSAASEIYKNVSKIKLMFKPVEPQAAKLFSLLDRVIERIGDIEMRRLDNTIIDEIVAELQGILKAEWEITKMRMAKEE